MSQKDYIALAAALCREKPGSHWDPNKMVQWELDVKAVANVLGNESPRFKRHVFMTACGMED